MLRNWHYAFRVYYYSFLKFEKLHYLVLINRYVLRLYKILYKFMYLFMVKNGFINIYIYKEHVYSVLFFLKNNVFCNCVQLLDFTVVDGLELSPWLFNRYEYIYLILSLNYNIRFMVRGFLKLLDYIVSLSELYNSIAWLEREIWDMYGIFFYNNKDLRRILTDYGFKGHPLRKDFPLSGYMELRYDDIFKTVVMEPLELPQEFRYYNLDNPWNKEYDEEDNVK